MLKRLGVLAIAGTMLVGLGAGEARAATMVAGWDFSQFFGEGFFSIDSTFVSVDTLDSNFSDLDTFDNIGRGVGSEAFGTFFFDGSNGSTAVDPDDFTGRPITPFSLSLESNLSAPTVGAGQFDSITVGDGQEFDQLLSLKINDPVSLVFRADLTSVPEQGTDWVLSFGGVTREDTATVNVDFSTDGVNFGPILAEETITDVDTRFEVALGSEVADMGFVRLNFSNVDFVQDARIDNVAITATTVPEPGAMALTLAGLAGVGLAGRWRRRR